MKIVGIVAEYNPFHKGHQYQLETLRKKYNADYIMIAMSGNFLQRGTPALIDKYTRTKMALLQGADLVFELPSWFATSSAETFATGGMLLFQTTGIATHVCFGAETDDLSGMQTLANILVTEPADYKDRLISHIKAGDSFPVARSKALPEYAGLLKSPNNILAIEYLKALLCHESDIEPILIPRKGSGYHDTDLDSPLASASGIRQTLFASPNPFDDLKNVLPEGSFRLLKDYEVRSCFLQENDFSLALHHLLLNATKDSLLETADMTEAIANRILSRRNEFLNWSDFADKCKTKDVTYTRISRIFTHLLLQITKENLLPYQNQNMDCLPYLRLLGFRKDTTPLLSELKKSTKAPLLTTPVSAETILDPYGYEMLKADLYAADLYRSILTGKTTQVFQNEYQQKLIIV